MNGQRNFAKRPAQTISRRRFVQGLVAGGVLVGLDLWRRPAVVRGAAREQQVLTGNQFALVIEQIPVNFTGYSTTATVINGSVPGPVLRWREGDTVTISVTNRLSKDTSIHWHGIRTPSNMDGVPGLSFSGIAPNETFVYRFPVRQRGTYWYHSHSAFQEQTGVYGPLIIDPIGKDPIAYDREYVVLLSDWTDEDPETVFSNLKQQSDYYNYHQRTLGTFFSDVRIYGLGPTLSDRWMWNSMNMSPSDILGVSGATYTYLLNGQPPAVNWTALFRPGERVRLRFINGLSMTIFDVRIPGLPMTIVQADGNAVSPEEYGQVVGYHAGKIRGEGLGPLRKRRPVEFVAAVTGDDLGPVYLLRQIHRSHRERDTGSTCTLAVDRHGRSRCSFDDTTH